MFDQVTVDSRLEPQHIQNAPKFTYACLGFQKFPGVITPDVRSDGEGRERMEREEEGEEETREERRKGG